MVRFFRLLLIFSRNSTGNQLDFRQESNLSNLEYLVTGGTFVTFSSQEYLSTTESWLEDKARLCRLRILFLKMISPTVRIITNQS